MSSKSEQLVFIDKPTIEHIMPQSWVKNWPLPDGSEGIDHWGLFLDSEDAETRVAASRKRDYVVDTLGNLTIVSTDLNIRQSNLPWNMKRPELIKHSLLPINQNLVETQIWDETAMLRRSEELFERAIRLWGR
jgi:hypothetical protein